MPKNKGKGGKNRRRGKNENEDLKRELIMKEEGQGYAKVDRMLGNGRLMASCFEDGQQRLCHIRGKLRKKIWVNQGDIVLLGLREFQDGKADVIFKYSTDEARKLKQLGQIPENANIDPDPANAGNEDIAFEYAASSSGADDSSDEEEEDLRAPGERMGGARLVKHEVPLENPNHRLGPEPGDLPPSSSEEDEDEEESQPVSYGRRAEPAAPRNRAQAREPSDEEPEGEQEEGAANNLYGGLRAGTTSAGAGGSKPKYTEKTRTGRVLNEREARRGQRGFDPAADGDVEHI